MLRQMREEENKKEVKDQYVVVEPSEEIKDQRDNNQANGEDQINPDDLLPQEEMASKLEQIKKQQQDFQQYFINMQINL